jgi:Fe-S oxidoreductase
LMLDTTKFDSSENCKLCGTCLSSCPVLNFEQDRAIAEKQRLNSGQSSMVLEKCTTCLSCDLYCPNGFDPYELILLRWNERYQKKGLPALARMVMPGDQASIWRQLYPLMPPDEQELIRNWRARAGKSGQDILLTGCFSAFSPYLTMTPLLAGLTPYGDERNWCSGGHIYQLGLLDVVEQVGVRLQAVFNELKPRKVVTMMAAEYAMLGKILPRRFNTSFDFEVVPLEHYLLDRLHSGRLKLDSRLNKRVAVHDNCFSKAAGDVVWSPVRELVQACGVKIIEMQHNREDALCCGFGAAAGRFDLFDLVAQGKKRLAEAEATGAEYLIVYCAACYFIFSVVSELVGSKLEIYHILELLDMAEGRQPPHRTRRRAFNIIAIMSANITRMLLQGKARQRFKIDLATIHRAPGPADVDFKPDRLCAFYNGFLNNPVIQNPFSLAILTALVRLALAGRRSFNHG